MVGLGVIGASLCSSNPNHTCAGPSSAHTKTLPAFPATSICYREEARPASGLASGVLAALPKETCRRERIPSSDTTTRR